MDYKRIISYRHVWMGMAMIWIILFHTDLQYHSHILKQIISFGYAGVDIFIFSSGIGNYYSYHRDEAPLEFLKRRLLRLTPVYTPFIAIWIAYKMYYGEMDWHSIVGNLMFIQGFSTSGIDFNWYIKAILICYLLTPYLAVFIKTHNLKQNIVLLLFLLLISTVFWKDSSMIICISRLPVFVTGMIVAKKGNDTVTKTQIFFATVAFIIGIVVLKTVVRVLYGVFMGLRLVLVSFFTDCSFFMWWDILCVFDNRERSVWKNTCESC